MRPLKLEKLVALNACPTQVELFRSKFGKSVNVTKELCRSVAGDFDFGWAAMNLLSPRAYAEYKRVEAPALAEYERLEASARAESRRTAAFMWFHAGYDYDRRKASALARLTDYDRANATAFAIAYNLEGAIQNET